MQGAAFDSDLFPAKRRCRRRLGEPMTPASTVCDFCTVEKRIRDEEAWRLQKSLQDSLFRFQDWLWAAEAVAAAPKSSQVSYADCKKELQRFQALQREISEKVWPLGSLNRQYHQLVWMGSLSPHLPSFVQEINRRWEELQTRAAAVSRRLQHFVNRWDEFGEEKDALQVWLMELDLRLTDVEHFSGGTLHEKMIQLQAFQQDVRANAEHVDHLLVCAERLIQRSQPEDAEILEEDLRDLIGFHQTVFSRVFQFQRRLVSMRLVFENEWESDRDSDLECDCFTEGSLEFHTRGAEPADLSLPAPLGQSTPQPALCRKQLAPSGDPLAADLEWDPSVDVGGSTSHDEDSSYCSAIMGFGHLENLRRRGRSLRLSCGKPEKSPEERASRLPRKGVCCQHAEAARFDPRRIETWLDQNCQNRMGAQPERKAGVRSPEAVLPPAGQPQHPLQSPPTGGPTRRPKLQRWPKRKSKRSLVTRPALPRKDRWVSKKTLLNSPSAEVTIAMEKECDPLLPSGISAQSQKFCRTSTLWLLSATVFALLLLLLARSSFLPVSKPSCFQTNGFAQSFHLMLKYEGPPPT